MKKLLFTLAASVAVLCAAAQDTPLRERLEKHVRTLAADSMGGRFAGSKYAMKAARYIVSQFEAAGVTPYEGRYFHPFVRHKDTMYNLAAVIPGKGKGFVVVGAHYDHLGFNNNGDIRPGADDNASGVAALIELARMLKQGERPEHSILLVAFDGEEVGLHGSKAFVKQLEEKGITPEAMVSIDMVGWLRGGELTYHGAATMRHGMRIMEGVPATEDLKVTIKKMDRMLAAGSDHDSFVAAHIPGMLATTGREPVLHTVKDRPDSIDYPGMAKVTNHLAATASTLASQKDIRFSGRLPMKHAFARRFVVAAEAGIGSSQHDYTEGGLTGKPSTSYCAGLTGYLRLNSYLSLIAQPTYEWRQAREQQGYFRTDNITLPLSISLTMNDSPGFHPFVSFGGYYSQALWGRYVGQPLDFTDTYKRDEWGIQGGISLFLGRVGVGGVFRRSLTDQLYTSPAAGGNVRNWSGYFTVSYVF